MTAIKHVSTALFAAVAALALSLTLGVSYAHAVAFENPPGDSATIYAGEGITLVARPGVWHGSGCSNYVEFTVTKGGTQLERQQFSYTSISARPQWSPTSLLSKGTYTVTVRTWYQRNDIWPTTDDTKSITITVKAPSSIKTVKPKVYGFYRYNNGKIADIAATGLKGADGYIVYRSLKKKSGYKKVATCGKSSDEYNKTDEGYKWCTNKKLSAKKTYYYKVRGYLKSGKKTLYTKYSKVVVSKKILGAPKFKSAKNKSGTATFKWGKVKGAAGYLVLVSSKKGGAFDAYLDKVPAKKTSYKTDLSWVDPGTYYFQIAAYTKTGTGFTLSKVSATKKLTFK